MRIIRRSLLALSFIGVMVCVVLLLNFTSPNPTHRRYSSEFPLTTGQGSSYEIGLTGELVLAHDLGLPRNDDPDQRQCVCGANARSSRITSGCRVCVATTPLVAEYHRPDFFGHGFIAESKNAQDLPYSGYETDQITSFVMAARALEVPLWVYVRVNTRVGAQFYDLVRSTGGDVVGYFTAQGYVDPIDLHATHALAISGFFTVLFILLEIALVGVRRTAAGLRSARRQTASWLSNASERTREFIRRGKARDDLPGAFFRLASAVGAVFGILVRGVVGESRRRVTNATIRATDHAEEFIRQSQTRERTQQDVEDTKNNP